MIPFRLYGSCANGCEPCSANGLIAFISCFHYRPSHGQIKIAKNGAASGNDYHRLPKFLHPIASS